MKSTPADLSRELGFVQLSINISLILLYLILTWLRILEVLIPPIPLQFYFISWPFRLFVKLGFYAILENLLRLNHLLLISLVLKDIFGHELKLVLFEDFFPLFHYFWYLDGYVGPGKHSCLSKSLRLGEDLNTSFRHS